MTEFSLRTVLVEADPDGRGRLRALVEATPSLSMLGQFPTINAAAASTAASRPDLLVVDLPQPNGDGAGPVLAGIERLARTFPESAILATGSAPSADFVVQVLRAGAFEFVQRPIEHGDLLAALDKLARFRRPSAATRRARITSVYSTKGGLGTTTVAINLAVCLAGRQRGGALLVELSTRQSDVTTFLDLRARYSILDAFENVGRMDEAFLKGVLTRHPSGLWVLPGPPRIERAHLGGDQVQAGLEILRGEFDEIVLDLPHDVEAATVAALELSDTILLLTTLNVSALRSTAAGIAAFRHLAIDQRKVKVVVMREGRGEEVTAKHVKETLGCPVFWKTPSDYHALVTAINAGKPIVTAAPRSKVAKNLKELAETLTSSPGASAGGRKRRASLLRFAWGNRQAARA